MDKKMKTAAENLLKIAEDLEERTLNETYFVCDSCNHTANLATINKVRKEAGELNNIPKIRNITANDSISCAVPGCQGSMSYVATEESAKYWVDAADETVEEDEEITPADDDKKDDDKSPFEPVDDQDKKKDEAPDDLDLGLGEEDEVLEKDTEKEKAPSGDEDAPAGDAAVPVDEAPAEGVIETEEEESVEKEPKKKPKKKVDKADDGKASLPKDDTPKFEKMPKEAGRTFEAAVARYSAIPER